MTQEEASGLTPGSAVGYKFGRTIVSATVLKNGPRIDIDGNRIPFTNELLIIQLGDGPQTVSWEPINYPDGIPELITQQT